MSHSLTYYSQLADHLLVLQSALHQADVWEVPEPTPEQMASTQPFAVDTMSFEQWLRYVFVARFKVMIEQQAPLPSSCNIAPMVETAFPALSSAHQRAIHNSLEAIDQHLTSGV